MVTIVTIVIARFEKHFTPICVTILYNLKIHKVIKKNLAQGSPIFYVSSLAFFIN